MCVLPAVQDRIDSRQGGIALARRYGDLITNVARACTQDADALRAPELDAGKERLPCSIAADASAHAGFVFHFYLLTDRMSRGKPIPPPVANETKVVIHPRCGAHSRFRCLHTTSEGCLRIQGINQARLMEESELCIAESAKFGTPAQKLVASRLLAHPHAYRRWEAEHSQLMRRVSEHRFINRQVVALRSTALSLLHRKAEFEYLQESQLSRHLWFLL